MPPSTNFRTRSAFKRPVITLITLAAFLFQTLMPAYATVISDNSIQTILQQNSLFQRSSVNGYHLYEKTPYVNAQAPATAQTLEGFYQHVYNTNRQALGEPTYVPVGSGGITALTRVYPRYRTVGDALVQSRFIRAQIVARLGRHLINTSSDGDQQYKNEATQINTLYNNAKTYLNGKPTLRFGQRLAFNQHTPLPNNMVWPELRTVNGQQVLVPVVYLTEATLNNNQAANRTEIRGNVALKNLQIDGTRLQLGRKSFLNILNKFVNNGGEVLSDDDLTILAGGSFTNISGSFDIGGNLQVRADTIHNETVVHRFDFGNEQGSYFGEIAEINADGSIVLRSHKDIVLLGTQVQAGENIILGANGNITISTVAATHEFSGSEGHWRQVQRSSVEYLGSRLTAEATIQLIADGKILIDASEIVAGGHIELLAGLGITVQDQLNISRSYRKGKFGKTRKEVSTYKTVAMRSLLDAGKDITLHAGFGDITLKAVDIRSTGGTSVTADSGGINLLVTRENDHYNYSAVKKSLFTIKTVNRGRTIETVVPNTIVGGLQVDALSGIKVEYEGDPNLGLNGQLDELQKMPGLEWIRDIRGQVSAEDWTAIQGKYEEWNESNTSLSPAAMALIAIAIAVVAGPAVVSLYGGASATAAAAAIPATVAGSTTLGAAAVAATTSLISTAALAAVNAAVNGEGLDGAFEAAFEAITSEDSLKSAAIAAVTAGR